jgi:oligopeptide transport system substrate-binding protein
MRLWSGKGLATAALALAVGLGAAGAASAQVTFVRGNDGDPETLDQHKTSTVAEANLLRDLYEGLVIEAANGDTVPASPPTGRFRTTGSPTHSTCATRNGPTATR